jgi:hypothetical protein
MEDTTVAASELIDAAFPTTLNPAALRAMMGEDAWRGAVDCILDTLPRDILAKMTERDAAQIMLAVIRAYLLTRVAR